MPAGLADTLKADEEDRKTDPAAATENEEVATLTATVETNLQQGDLETRVASLSEIQTSVSSFETWLREDLENVYALLFRNGIDTRLALCSVGWERCPIRSAARSRRAL